MLKRYMSHWTAWSLWTVHRTGVDSYLDKNGVTGLPRVAWKVCGVKKEKMKKKDKMSI